MLDQSLDELVELQGWLSRSRLSFLEQVRCYCLPNHACYRVVARDACALKMKTPLKMKRSRTLVSLDRTRKLLAMLLIVLQKHKTSNVSAEYAFGCKQEVDTKLSSIVHI